MKEREMMEISPRRGNTDFGIEWITPRRGNTNLAQGIALGINVGNDHQGGQETEKEGDICNDMFDCIHKKAETNIKSFKNLDQGNNNFRFNFILIILLLILIILLLILCVCHY